MVPPCPFCELPEEFHTWSNDLVVAIRDRFPVAPGHTLLITRRHVATWFDASAAEQHAVLQAIERVKVELDREFAPHGYNIGINAGEAAGQTVMHLHVHVIPRFRGDMDDPRGGVRGVIPHRQKYDSPDPFAALAAFIPGEETHLVGVLHRAMAVAAEIDVLAAFVQSSGIDKIEGELVDALERGTLVRLLTGTYLGITDPRALQRLYTLTTKHPGLTVRLYQVAGKEVFHPKAYIFANGRYGVAFVGSSNLSGSALTGGIEWNSKTSNVDQDAFRSIRARFAQLFESGRAASLTPEILAAYQHRVPAVPAPEPAGPPPPQPHAIQQEVLAALHSTRTEGEVRGLVVMATGLGKTLLAGFDFAQMRGRRALFVAHRDEILAQSERSWASVLPDRSIGFVTGDRKQPDADIVLASVATLSRQRHLRAFAPDHFDYVVIDEFHHASAASYRKLLAHFTPAFLLGLTATPDRMDGAPLLELCDENLVARVGLFEGITRGFLVPFHYHGVADELDFSVIPWRSGRFDIEKLTTAVATRDRAAQALREYLRHAPGPRRSLIFCSSQIHADFIAAYFCEHGVAAAAVHAGPTSAPRAQSVAKLRNGELEALVAVDLFNEGFDVPDVNTILMLRPTESPIVFLQQLGRGLRKGQAGDKPALRVIDFIGNHRSFLAKPQVLVSLAGFEVAVGDALRRLRQCLELPPGCSIDIETAALDILEGLVHSHDDALVYEYCRLRDTHGRRPTARELLAANGTFTPIRKRFGTWFEFVAAMNDLTEPEQRVLEAHRPWFADLMATQMTRSYKMVALQVLDDADLLHDSIEVPDLAERCLARMRRDPALTVELREHEQAGATLEDFTARWREMPLRIFHVAKGFARQWFALEGEHFVSKLGVAPADRDAFDEMTAELVELRLAEHQRKPSTGSLLPFAAIPLAVSHSGGKPILRFDRDRHPAVPHGDMEVEVDGESLIFRFKKIAVNVVIERPGGPNVLAERLRSWLGPKAGLPGTRHTVDLRRTPAGAWHLERHGAMHTLPTVHLPYFRELAVACGAASPQFSDVPTEDLVIRTERTVDPRRHFVVRATGDSMDGGSMPIRDGDCVLCEWSTQLEEGRPALVAAGSADDGIALIKVPVERDGSWWLRSTNPAYPEVAVDTAVEFRVVARVIWVVEADSAGEGEGKG